MFSRSSCPPNPPVLPLFLPTASISSIKMIQGEFFRAWLKRSLTRAGPTPTNISRNSEPEMLRKGTSASPAVALASSVLPVPGGPDRMAPCKYSEGGEGYLHVLLHQSTNVASCTGSNVAHLGYLGTQVLVLFWVLEKVHKLHNLQLSLLTPGHITAPQRTGQPNSPASN